MQKLALKHSYPSRDQMILLHHRLLKLPPFTQSARVRGKQCPRDSQSSTLFPLVEIVFEKQFRILVDAP